MNENAEQIIRLEVFNDIVWDNERGEVVYSLYKASPRKSLIKNELKRFGIESWKGYCYVPLRIKPGKGEEKEEERIDLKKIDLERDRQKIIEIMRKGLRELKEGKYELELDLNNYGLEKVEKKIEKVFEEVKGNFTYKMKDGRYYRVPESVVKVLEERGEKAEGTCTDFGLIFRKMLKKELGNEFEVYAIPLTYLKPKIVRIKVYELKEPGTYAEDGETKEVKIGSHDGTLVYDPKTKEWVVVSSLTSDGKGGILQKEELLNYKEFKI